MRQGNDIVARGPKQILPHRPKPFLVERNIGGRTCYYCPTHQKMG